MTPQARRRAAGALTCALLAMLPATSAHAFFEGSGAQGDASLRGFFRFSTTTTLNPPPDLLYPHDNDAQALTIFRLLGDAHFLELFSLEMNVYQVITSTTQPTPTLTEPFRTDALEWRWSGASEASAQLAVDRLALRLSTDHLDLTLGRQPISFAATYFFTPNDAFAPFVAQNFFRAWKPGVDAARAELTVGDFTQVQIAAVLGYRPDAEGLDTPTLGRSAVVGRASTVVADFELGLLGGRLPTGIALGADAQGTLFEWLGVRLEGHALLPEGDPADVKPEVALTLEHLFESSLNLQWETFYHGAGATAPDGYLQGAADPRRTSPWLGRLYTAAGASYELTPLLNASVLAIVNVLDPSVLGAVYLLYSVSNEAELALTLNAPLGARIDGLQPRSEFGLYPGSLGADFRLTF